MNVATKQLTEHTKNVIIYSYMAEIIKKDKGVDEIVP